MHYKDYIHHGLAAEKTSPPLPQGGGNHLAGGGGGWGSLLIYIYILYIYIYTFFWGGNPQIGSLDEWTIHRKYTWGNVVWFPATFSSNRMILASVWCLLTNVDICVYQQKLIFYTQCFRARIF